MDALYRGRGRQVAECVSARRPHAHDAGCDALCLRRAGAHRRDLLADARFEGKSSYNLKKKIKMALEIITSQSNKPLLFSIHLGFISALISFAYILYLVVRALFVGDVLLGWTTIVASIYLVGGALLAAIGILGIYIGNIFDEAKNRPLYVIAESLNSEE